MPADVAQLSPSSRNRAPIVLLTDFGEQDWFVGVMKGVLVGIAPASTIIDLCHEVRPGDLREAALMLEAAAPHFPPGSVFCCVVDPGVGTERRVLVAQDEGRSYVAPDNGLLSRLSQSTQFRAVDLERHRHLLAANPSATFHGRDIFAPLAAHISRGHAVAELGPLIGDAIRLPPAKIELLPDRAKGCVQHVDRFGNLITNLRFDEMRARYGAHPLSHWCLRVQNLILSGLSRSYGDSRPGEFLFYAGSLEYLEIAENRGHAARRLGLERDIDVPVELFFKERGSS